MGLLQPRYVLGLALVAQSLAVRPSAEVSGRVMLSEPGDSRPASGAEVVLRNLDTAQRLSETSDTDGLFKFSAVAPGRYSLAAFKSGLVSVSYGATRPGGFATPISVGVVPAPSYEVLLLKGAVISGSVLNDVGQPQPHTPVSIVRYRETRADEAAAATLFEAPEATISALSDDRGEFRIFGLVPGKYLVRAAWRDPSTAQAAPVPVFAPGTVNRAEAQVFDLDAGEEARASIRTVKMQRFRVSGQVMGKTSASSPVRLFVRPGGPFVEGATAATDGRFVFEGIIPGSYTLQARELGAVQGGFASWGEMSMQVGQADVAGLNAVLTAPLTISGSVRLDGAAADVQEVRVTLRPAYPWTQYSISAVTARESGAFLLQGVAPGIYRLTASVVSRTGNPWRLVSAVVQGKDVTSAPLVVDSVTLVTGVSIVLTSRQQTLRGKLFDEAGVPATKPTLILFPTERERRERFSTRIVVARPATDGEFVFGDILPGDYRLAVVIDVDPEAVTDPGFLRNLESQSIPVLIAPGESKRLDLRQSGKSGVQVSASWR